MAVRRSSIALSLASVVAGCSLQSGQGLRALPIAAAGAITHTKVVQKGKGAQWVQFRPKTAASVYSAMVTGPDKNVWFIDYDGAALVRMSMTGAVKEFRIPGLTPAGAALTVGADGDFYIGYQSTNILRATTSGKATTIPIPSGDSTALGGVALGPDGNVWFTEYSHVGKVTPAGKVAEFAYPSGPSSNQYGGLAAGADGNVWFAESAQNKIGRIVPSTGKITEYAISSACVPAPLVLGNDGNVWFACLSSPPALGNVTPNGTITLYSLGDAYDGEFTEQFCQRGPDGELWCASGPNGTVFRVDTREHTLLNYVPPLGSGVSPSALTAGPDGNVWVDTQGGEIDVLVPNPMTVSPLSLSFTATGQNKNVTVTESGTTAWTATSSNTSVATVPQHSKSGLFKVTAVGAGSCKITISDGAGNTVAVSVKVT